MRIQNMKQNLFDGVYGSIIGGAIGDALGAPIEGWRYWEIRDTYGKLTELTVNEKMKNNNAKPGGVTDDTTLRGYLALSIIKKGGRILPNDLAGYWIDKGLHPRLWANERIVFEKITWGVNPWHSGNGNIKSCTGMMGIGPIGLINAGNPVQAYQDGFNVGSVIQELDERDAAATFAAGIAAALVPGATLDDVIKVMMELSPQKMQRAIDLTMDLAVECGNVDRFVEKFYEIYADWTWPLGPQMGIKPVPDGYPKKGRYYSGDSYEMLPVVLAMIHLTGGDVNQSIIESANFGRDCDTISSFTGLLAGALQGASSIRKDWIETVELANEDLFEYMEGDKSANFRSQADRMMEALAKEREAAQRRVNFLDQVL
jgi:ADP-ribosylglycohydrolase